MADLRFDGQVAIVTGAGSDMGLGFQYARLLTVRGAKVLVNDIKEDQIKERVKDISAAGGEAIAKAGDVSDVKQVEGMVQAALDEWGRVDMLVNNASVDTQFMWPDFDDDDIIRVFRVNVVGSLNMMRAVWPHMEKQHFGRIVNISSNSVFGFVPIVSYPVSKAGILGLTRISSMVGAGCGINVNAIAPAAYTQMTAQLGESDFGTRLAKECQPAKVAPVVAFLCHKDCKYNGEFFSVGAGRVARYNFAKTFHLPAATIEDVKLALEALHADSVQLKYLNNTFDDMVDMGFTDDEYDMFRM